MIKPGQSYALQSHQVWQLLPSIRAWNHLWCYMNHINNCVQVKKCYWKHQDEENKLQGERAITIKAFMRPLKPERWQHQPPSLPPWLVDPPEIHYVWQSNFLVISPQADWCRECDCTCGRLRCRRCCGTSCFQTPCHSWKAEARAHWGPASRWTVLSRAAGIPGHNIFLDFSY